MAKCENRSTSGSLIRTMLVTVQNMTGDNRRPRPWKLAEAVRRTVDHDVLAECIAAQRSWRQAGAPRRFSTRSTYVEGNDAHAANCVSRAHRNLLTAAQSRGLEVESA